MKDLSTELGLTLDDRRALVFVAHYDDEVLFCGGTLLRAAQRCAALAIAVLTDVACTNSPRKPAHLARSACWELDRQRRRLTAFSRVCGALGAEGRHFCLRNLSFGEGTDHPLHREILDQGIELLSRSIDDFSPDVMFFHGAQGEYGHAQHLLAHAIAKAVWQGPARCFTGPDSTCREPIMVTVPEFAKRVLVRYYRHRTTQEPIWDPYAKPEYRSWCGRYEYFYSF